MLDVSPTQSEFPHLSGKDIPAIAGPLFTKRQDVLPPNLVKFRSRETGCYNDRITLQFDRRLGSAVTDVPVKLQND